ncbi:hypothetical protein [Pedosphaera parvula]|nr:hypothetical protein [Pedosphaera parvula]
MAIKCVLERENLNTPYMEGKSLLAAYCGEGLDGYPEEAQTADNIILVNFSDGHPMPNGTRGSGDALLSSLDEFLCHGPALRWHEAGKGLGAVRDILGKIRDGGVMVSVPSDLGHCCDQREFNTAVIFDLEQLELILEFAQKRRTKFCLTFEV